MTTFIPEKIAENPGIDYSGSVAFSNDEASWTETFNLATLLKGVLKEQGFNAELDQNEGWLTLPNNIYLRADLVEFSIDDKGDLRTCTTVTIAHPDLIPQGLFEYQHSFGDSLEASLQYGLEQWVKVDFSVLHAAITGEKADEFSQLKIEFPEPEIYKRQILLGYVSHLALNRELFKKDEHPFCSCCFFTNTMNNFDHVLKSNQLFGIRLLAIKDAEGNCSADCRVNGIDDEAGKQALINYASTWQDRGYEMRKQYVVVRNL